MVFAQTLSVTGLTTISSSASYSDIVVKNGGELNITGSGVILSVTGAIGETVVVENGGKLKVNLGATLNMTLGNDMLVEPGGQVFLSTGTIKMNSGYIALLSQWYWEHLPWRRKIVRL